MAMKSSSSQLLQLLPRVRPSVLYRFLVSGKTVLSSRKKTLSSSGNSVTGTIGGCLACLNGSM